MSHVRARVHGHAVGVLMAVWAALLGVLSAVAAFTSTAIIAPAIGLATVMLGAAELLEVARRGR